MRVGYGWIWLEVEYELSIPPGFLVWWAMIRRHTVSCTTAYTLILVVACCAAVTDPTQWLQHAAARFHPFTHLGIMTLTLPRTLGPSVFFGEGPGPSLGGSQGPDPAMEVRNPAMEGPKILRELYIYIGKVVSVDAWYISFIISCGHV